MRHLHFNDVDVISISATSSSILNQFEFVIDLTCYVRHVSYDRPPKYDMSETRDMMLHMMFLV